MLALPALDVANDSLLCPCCWYDRRVYEAALFKLVGVRIHHLGLCHCFEVHAGVYGKSDHRWSGRLRRHVDMSPSNVQIEL